MTSPRSLPAGALPGLLLAVAAVAAALVLPAAPTAGGRTAAGLEYDAHGRPGNEWSSDTTQALGDLFEQFGITFTIPR